MRKIRRIVIHCSDTEDSLDISARDIREWHTRDNGWSDIGYHYVVRRNGTLEKGRDLDQIGAHVQGHNKDSIGICWVGRKQISSEQYTSLLAVVRGLMNMFNLTVDNVYGHKELDDHKTCPNLDMDYFRAELLFFTTDRIGDKIKRVMDV